MKNLLLMFILLLPTSMVAMEQPNPTITFAALPFFNNKRTLISFAQSVVMGTCKPYDRDKIFCLEFPDYKTPHILSYVEPAKDAHDAIRYMIELGKLKSREDDATQDSDQPVKAADAIAQIQETKKDENILADMAMARFFHFWHNDDLYPVTAKDRSRDMEAIKQNRVAFFAAIATNNASALRAIAGSALIKKPTRPLLEILDKMIERIQTHRDFNNYAPQDSDEEII